MRELLERPLVKWGVFLVVLAGAVVLIVFVIRNTFFPPRGLPQKETMVTLTCTNTECSGRSHETAPPDSAADVLGPYRWQQKVWTDYGDWPMVCPKCGQRSVYHKHEISPGSFVTIHKMTDPSVILPSGRILVVESLMGGPWRDEATGENAVGDIWAVPQQ